MGFSIVFFLTLNISIACNCTIHLSAKERAALLEQAGDARLTLSFYEYAHIGNPELFRNHLFLAWDSLGVLGRIYVAKEGINAQLSVPGEKF